MTQWPELLKRVQHLVGADAVIQFAVDETASGGQEASILNQDHVLGLSPESAAFYAELAPSSPLANIVLRAPTASLLPVYSLVTPREFKKTDFYDRWVRPHDMEDALISPLTGGVSPTTVINFLRAKGSKFPPFGEGNLSQGIAMAHLSGALRLNARLAVAQLMPNGVAAEMLNAMTTGVICMSREGKVVWANAAADRILATRDGLALDRNRRLAPSLRSEGLLLERLVTRAANGQGDGVSVTRPSGRMALCLTSRPLREQRDEDIRSILGDRNPVATIVAIYEPDRRFSESEDVDLRAKLSGLYGLTPAEALACILVVRHKGLGAVAEILGVSRSTVHSHLKQVFHKMDARSQNDLSRRIEGLQIFRPADS